MGHSQIFLLDHDATHTAWLRQILPQQGYRPTCFSDGARLLDALQTHTPDVLLLEFWLPGLDGLALLQILSGSQHPVPVVMMSAHASLSAVIRATHLGAIDCLEKPLSTTRLLTALRRARHRHPRPPAASVTPGPSLFVPWLAQDTPLANALRPRIKRAALDDHPLFIHGATAPARKELARLIHQTSDHREGPFVVCPGSALPLPMPVTQAAGGTLLIDGIETLAPERQLALLHAFASETPANASNVRLMLSGADRPRLPGAARGWHDLALENPTPPVRSRPAPRRRAAGDSRPRQRTLSRSVTLYGHGLQSGARTGVILSPLPPDSGIVFSNITSGERVPATCLHVESTAWSTSLRRGDMTARTVEHLMSALHAYRISNLLITLDDEVPIMDGSAAAFCHLIEHAGVAEQDAFLEEFCIDRCYAIGASDAAGKSIRVAPYDGLRITYRLDYPPPLGVQEVTYEHRGGAHYAREIAAARTFAFVDDVQQMHETGLVAGGRLNNVILLGAGRILNATRLRYADECARHKVLDLMGDLYLLGKPFRGSIRAHMTGHTDNVALVRHLAETTASGTPPTG